MFKACAFPWEYYTPPFKIVEGLYFVGNKYVSVHLIDTGDGLLLIDTALPQTLYQLIENIRILGFSPYDIKHILHTHAHYDHCGATKALVSLTGAKTYMGRADIDTIENRPELIWATEYGVEFNEKFDVDFPIDDGDIIEIGKLKIECLSTPGHTAGTTAFFFDIIEKGKNYRVGIHGGPGLNTLRKEYLDKHKLSIKNRELYMSSLEKLLKRDVDIFIGAHPRHNDLFAKQMQMTDEYNPFIDKDQWKEFISKLKSRAIERFSEE